MGERQVANQNCGLTAHNARGTAAVLARRRAARSRAKRHGDYEDAVRAYGGNQRADSGDFHSIPASVFIGAEKIYKKKKHTPCGVCFFCISKVRRHFARAVRRYWEHRASMPGLLSYHKADLARYRHII